MSRILQTLKADEARPNETPAPAGAQTAAAAVTSGIQLPLAPRQVTERIAPRRNAPAPEEVEQLLGSLEAGGTEISLFATDLSSQSQLVMQQFVEEVRTRKAASSLAVSSEATIDLSPSSEIDLEFNAIQPRRAPVVEVPPLPLAPQRAALETREQEVRKAVRGPRADSVVRACAWETTIQADLEDAVTVAPYASLVRRWQQDRASGQGTILVATLAQPLAAAEVAMRAATLLTRQDDAAVLIIDGDVEGTLSRRLAIIGKPGLSDLLNPQDAHGETIQATSTPRLHVLPRGRGAWPALTEPAAVQRLLTELGHDYAWLIVVVGDASSAPVASFARQCAATYAVAPLGDTDVALAQQQLAALQAAGARIMGAIATESAAF